MSVIGERLRKARERKKLKQTQVKDRTGINNKTLSGYENGVSEPDSETLKVLAELYEVSIDWIHGRDKKGSTYALPESVYDQIIKETEEKYNVNLHDDPFVVETMRNIIDSYAKTKVQKR